MHLKVSVAIREDRRTAPTYEDVRELRRSTQNLDRGRDQE